MHPLFRKESSPDRSGFEITLESLEDDSCPDIPGILIEVRRFPFHIGRVAGSGAGHRVGADFLLIDDPKPHNVSRDHCSIDLVDGTLSVRDRGSTLGTKVNGLYIGQHFSSMRATLGEGENTLLLGSSHSPHRFRVQVVRHG